MAVPNGSIDIWNFVDNVTGTTVRKWLRDSWARRKIVALQQAITAIVVPTASTANPQMDGTAAPGSSTDYSRADHVHPHDTSKADAATTYTKTEIDGMIPSVPSASTSNPAMDGTASPGSSTAWARGDHVHPHDTSKADKATTLAGYGITNAYTKTEVDGMIPTVPANVSAFTNDAGYVTSAKVNKSGADVITTSSGFSGANIASVTGKTQGNICQINATIGSGTYSSGANNVGTLTSEFRPSDSTVFGVCFFGASSAVGTVGRFAISTAGVLTIYAPSAISNTVRFSAVFARTF